MRIGCLQFAPQVGDIDNNLNRADSCLNKANTDDLDLLVLPELAFTGYNFKSLQHISPYLEPSGSGITALWARTTALKYNCNVVVGYPEKVDVSNNWPTGPEYYNSAIVVNGDGETIANYRKSFLYYTDETWALEGNKGFYEGWIPGLGNTSMGICMDLNPYKFQAPWHAFEFAFHVLEYESNLVIVSMAWMTREDGRLFSRMPNEPDMDTLTYWVTRLEPLIRSENDEEIIVVFCNRTGNEDEAVYAGTSAVIGVQDGEVKIYGLLGRGEKELLVIDTNNPPYAKLVYRPEPDKPSAVHSELKQTGASPSSVNGSATSSPPRQGVTKHGVSTHTPTQPTSPPQKSSFTQSSSSQKHQVKSPSSRQAKSPPKIEIPSNTGSYTRDTPDSINLPTPTAPSPTPQAIRPKLIIPQSPPLQPWQSGSPVPQSSQSIQSVHSVLSNHSVQSNPRPPEDSTPYPHSGAPLSGYPRKGGLGGAEKKIYGGSVSITQVPFTPITPFEDQSPMAQRYFWRPSDSLLEAPMESHEKQSVAEPDDTRTQTFHFPPFTQNEPAARTHSSNSMRTVATAGSSRSKKTNSDQSSKEKRRAPSQNSKARRSSKSRSGDSNSSRGEVSRGDSSTPARPSSPKSRNASRTRMLDRSESAMAQREQASQQLGPISQRAESVNRNRGASEENGTSTPQPDRPSSPKSRNCSRSRPSEHLSSILIAASPSIYHDEYNRRSLPALPDTQKTQPQRPMSRMNQRSRTGSVTEIDKNNLCNARPSSRASVGGEQSSLRPASRAASRGRQPGSKFSPPKMSPRDPSLPPEQDPDDIVRIVRERASSMASKPGMGSPSSEPAYERVEAIVCPTCPVHGRHSTSSAPGDSSTLLGHRISPDLSVGRSLSSPAAATTVGNVAVATTSKVGDDPNYSITGSNKPSDAGSLAETIETVSTTSRSPSTPRFEPKTPRAMVVVRDVEVPGIRDELPSELLAKSFSDLICTDRNVGPPSDGPPAIAA
ncbi:N-terminal amidase [Colletotrichum abscissum]|uniref:N-terminal amidase n=1 Tax=Colletotrichum abscissum TaxID=1671311 RepID=A0A9P9X4T4_9PEZI|nr:N-terminal amidase [Colletotrichum abscissum]KAI3536655.1 N-terminal amidase [Colletotrichum abscissum]KAK1475039.1 N-terminal amidase [Colletotrichum abscissum]